jgi:hypothetical protein
MVTNKVRCETRDPLGLRCALALLALVLIVGRASPAAAAASWIFVSDVHLEPRDASPRPSTRGHDTNEALLRSALAEMKRVDPSAPVVVIDGDFIGHRFDPGGAFATLARVARSFGAAFPRAQFVLALGNEDSDCGDYAAGPGAPFLRAVAAAWAPLVDRGGAAPRFRATFARDGFYVAKLPVAGLRVIAIDDVFASPRFRAACGSGGSAADGMLDELERALPPGGAQKAWVAMHLPPGVDAYSTVHLAHGLGVVPFLESRKRDRLLALLDDPRRNVALALAGHTHKFGFRVIGSSARHDVPLLSIPALSPIFHNRPMFLTAGVGAGGTLGPIDEYAYDGSGWRVAHASRELGIADFSGPALRDLERRLDAEPPLRAVYARLYDGGAAPEITAENWRGYWCALGALGDSAYRHCVGERGIGFVTLRGFVAAGALGLAALAAVVAALFAGRSALRAAGPRGR